MFTHILKQSGKVATCTALVPVSALSGCSSLDSFVSGCQSRYKALSRELSLLDSHDQSKEPCFYTSITHYCNMALCGLGNELHMCGVITDSHCLLLFIIKVSTLTTIHK